jgi:tetratricopeptide (TPR) repeat protein
VPLVGQLPLIGELFTTRNNAAVKSELVVFLRPVIIKDASLNGDFSRNARCSPARPSSPSRRKRSRSTFRLAAAERSRMSLLMDALKRAEASKQEAARAAAGHETPPVAAGEMSLEPRAAPGAGGTSLPELAAHIDALDADLATTPPLRRPPPAPPPRTPSGAPEAEDLNLAAARNAFAAKQQEPPSRRPMWLALGTLGVAMAGIGAYVVYQMQSLSGGSLTPPAGGPAAVAQRPAPPVAPPPAPAPALPLSPPAPQADLPRISPSTAAAPPAASRPAFSSRAESAAAMPPGEERTAAPTIRLTRSRPAPDANVEAGYASLQGNRLDTARHDYERALKSDPNNVDALLALAAIAQRQGRSSDADRYRQRALDRRSGEPGGPGGGSRQRRERRPAGQ